MTDRPEPRRDRPPPEERLASLPRIDTPADLVERVVRAVEQERTRPSQRALQNHGEELLAHLGHLPTPRSLTARVLWRLRRRVTPARRRPRALMALAAVGACLALVLLARSPGVEDPGVGSRGSRRHGSLVHISQVSGGASITRGQSTFRATSDEELLDGDLLETAADGRVEIVAGDYGRLVLDDLSQLSCLSAGGPVLRFDVRRGRVEARLWDGGEQPWVQFRNRDYDVRVVRGSAGLVRVGGGGLAVAALDDATVIDVAGRRVLLNGGYLVRLEGHGVPRLQPEPVPQALSLQLSQVRALRLGENSVVIDGRTQPDVLLVINDHVVEVDAAGSFVATLPVVPTTREVHGRVRDAFGREQRHALTLVRVSARLPWKESG